MKKQIYGSVSLVLFSVLSLMTVPASAAAPAHTDVQQVTGGSLCMPSDASYIVVTAPTTGNQYKVFTPQGKRGQDQISALAVQLDNFIGSTNTVAYQTLYNQYETLVGQYDTCN